MSKLVHYVVGDRRAGCDVPLGWNPWGAEPLPDYTREAAEVTCPKCLEKMADRVEEAMEEPDTMLATGAELDQLAANFGIARRRAAFADYPESDAQLRIRIKQSLGLK